MVEELVRQAVKKKCSFDHVILLGNYELAYALGVLSRAASIEKCDSFEKVGELKEYVMEHIKDYEPDSVPMQRLMRITKEMEMYTDDYDPQMYNVYSMGYEDGEIT